MQSWQITGRLWRQASTHSSISTCSATAWTWCAPRPMANLSTAKVCTSTLLHDGVLADSQKLSYINSISSCISNLIVRCRQWMEPKTAFQNVPCGVCRSHQMTTLTATHSRP